MIKILLLILLIGPFQPGNISVIVWSVVEHSRVYAVLAAHEREVKYWATYAFEWNVEDYSSTLMIYYNLLYYSLLHNELDDAAKYCGILLSLLLKAKVGGLDKLLPLLDAVDWGSVRIMDLPPDELIERWILFEPDSTEELMYEYVSTCLSILDKMPVNSFIRILYTPMVREMYLTSLLSILLASMYFVYKRSRIEGGEVDVEAPP